MAVTAVREDGSLILPAHARPLVAAILRVTVPHARILREITRLGQTIVRHSGVSAKQLAVVLQVVDVDAGQPVMVAADAEANKEMEKTLLREMDGWNAVWAMMMMHFDVIVGQSGEDQAAAE
ncbi:hypothetical protein HDU96_000991 [Phlyctochytrium bullatum]|nr:hypothetical protein HDU96_000991 [Phlyctochytrium bullatum]